MKYNNFILSFILSKCLLFGSTFSYIINTNQNIIFSIIVSYFLGYIILNIFINKNKNNIIKNITLYLIDVILLVFNIYNLTIFFHEHYLTNTPIFLILIPFLFIIIYGASKKIDGVSNLAGILFYINILLIALGIIFNIENFNYNNLLLSINNINTNIVINIIFITLASVLPVIYYLELNNNYNKKSILNGYLSGGITLLLINMSTILTLGTTLISYYNHPEYMAFKKINLLGFIERIENIISIYYLFDIIIFSIILVLYLYKIKELFKFK